MKKSVFKKKNNGGIERKWILKEKEDRKKIEQHREEEDVEYRLQWCFLSLTEYTVVYFVQSRTK